MAFNRVGRLPRRSLPLRAVWVFIATSAVALSALFFSAGAPLAHAEDIDTDPQPDALQAEVERTAAEYEAAQAEVQATEEAIEQNRARIQELEALIPLQQERSDAAARELYKLGNSAMGVLDFLLGSTSFHDFLTNLDYVNRVSSANMAEIVRLNALQDELEDTQRQLSQERDAAQARTNEAERALAAAQEARLEAQRKAQEAARQQAEAAAAAAAASGAAGARSSDAGEPNGDAGAAEPAAAIVDDGADWTSDEAAFIQEWASRIDAYLAGSALAGQGRTFAQAAWNYGVDPRWSPAISTTESGKGAYCFLPHNAWGWGSVSWDSWEEAIDGHVRGLARGYGYTISQEAAQKYCPPNWEHWYNLTLSEMNRI